MFSISVAQTRVEAEARSAFAQSVCEPKKSIRRDCDLWLGSPSVRWEREMGAAMIVCGSIVSGILAVHEDSDFDGVYICVSYGHSALQDEVPHKASSGEQSESCLVCQARTILKSGLNLVGKAAGGRYHCWSTSPLLSHCRSGGSTIASSGCYDPSFVQRASRSEKVAGFEGI